ncbi:hypothetical protein [Candidatus Nitrotoga arctica]|uniref:hypothetical protein n=1 Tax=Candidatus Nitrotoga arctica TaxID=453162 RepID=UPI001EFADB47|nr:hypothetical protein [Candidatus Nitrotoga arctica]
MIEVRRYQRIDGEVPLTDWLIGMRDVRAMAKLEICFRRVSLGIFGDIKPVGEGVPGVARRHWSRLSRVSGAAWRDVGHPALRQRQAHAGYGHQTGQGILVGLETEKT